MSLHVELLEERCVPTTLRTVSPINGAVGVAAATNVTVSFNELMNPATINPATFELRDRSNALVLATVNYDLTTNTATLHALANLQTVADYYTVRVKGGATGVMDANGNPLASDFVWGFSTGTPAFQETQVFAGLTNPTAVRFSPDGRVFENVTT